MESGQVDGRGLLVPGRDSSPAGGHRVLATRPTRSSTRHAGEPVRGIPRRAADADEGGVGRAGCGGVNTGRTVSNPASRTGGTAARQGPDVLALTVGPAGRGGERSPCSPMRS
ncbi:hypothetical protein GCM10027168_15900 [Streptomyces capparidis]